MLAELQARLYAQDRWAVLLVFQAMDAAGKDSAIKHVMSGVNPSGLPGGFVQGAVTGGVGSRFPVALRGDDSPSAARSASSIVRTTRKCSSYACTRTSCAARSSRRARDQRHLARAARGHPRHFERYLARNGVKILQVLSQRVARGAEEAVPGAARRPEKHWKFSAADVRERQYWKDYMAAFEHMIQHTATDYAPWYVVPADNKWFTRIVVASAVIDANGLPQAGISQVAPARRAELAKARRGAHGRKVAARRE